MKLLKVSIEQLEMAVDPDAMSVMLLHCQDVQCLVSLADGAVAVTCFAVAVAAILFCCRGCLDPRS